MLTSLIYHNKGIIHMNHRVLVVHKKCDNFFQHIIKKYMFDYYFWKEGYSLDPCITLLKEKMKDNTMSYVKLN